MLLERTPGQSECMDESTIDCQLCGHEAFVEVVFQVLTDAAEWRTTGRWTACERHSDLFRFTPQNLPHNARVTLMRCS